MIDGERLLPWKIQKRKAEGQTAIVTGKKSGASAEIEAWMQVEIKKKSKGER